MLTELQIGYLAGLLDGEGQVSIAKNIRRDDKKRKRNYALRVEVRIVQRRKILLDKLLEWIGAENGSIGGNGLGGHYFVLRFHAEWLRANLPAIIPHLILKRRQAEIVTEFLSFPRWPGRNGVGEEHWRHRDALKEEVMRLNLDRSNALT